MDPEEVTEPLHPQGNRLNPLPLSLRYTLMNRGPLTQVEIKKLSVGPPRDYYRTEIGLSTRQKENMSINK